MMPARCNDQAADRSGAACLLVIDGLAQFDDVIDSLPIDILRGSVGQIVRQIGTDDDQCFFAAP